METTFDQIATGTKFIVNGTEYIKTDEVRVSCCKTINCYASADANQKGYFPGNTTVMVVNG